ncbi:MAG: hypothetical protein K0R36_1953 [Chryseobacterium sp.]|jgi:hypothetical protein|nr:hypothetical protein [Chryseobacterium sp.]
MSKQIFLKMMVFIWVCYSCSTVPSNYIRKAQWLAGRWENRTSRGIVYESWKKSGKNELSGRSYSIKGSDTLILETIRIFEERGRLFYIPTVKDQNGGSPVRFEAISVSSIRLIFENRFHDFPQVISYQKIGRDSLEAEISGLRNGKDEHRTFPMKHIH